MAENFFAATFQRWNPQTNLYQQELMFVELYANKQEDDTKRLLVDYLSGDKRITTTEYSSMTMETTPLIAMETYILPQTVKQIALTETQHHITGRSLVCVTAENQVFSIKDMMFSARRPFPPVQKDFMQELKDKLEEDLEEKEKPIELKDDKYPRYEPVIPQQSKKYLSYDMKLVNLSEVMTFTTRLESTTQVFAYGHDLFLSRMMPDNGYDLLDEDFSYIALFAFIVVLIIGDFVLSQFLKKRTAIKMFLTR